jgi:hypothetical protein
MLLQVQISAAGGVVHGIGRRRYADGPYLSIQAVLAPPFLALLTPAVLDTGVATDDIGFAACVVVASRV